MIEFEWKILAGKMGSLSMLNTLPKSFLSPPAVWRFTH